MIAEVAAALIFIAGAMVGALLLGLLLLLIASGKE